MASLSSSMMAILNVMFIFTLVSSSGYARPFISPRSGPTDTNIQNLKVVEDHESDIKNSESSQEFSFDFPFSQDPFQSPLPNFPFPKIPGFPFPNLPPFNIPDIPTIPFPAPPPM
ncbi:uncharacterized protein LOC111888836 [Lactuca sativa]|uniref:uncharacterized protein LOC111888836 n=1 Tax=Lactuca sativa TaxID=4236 RepID=UPI000CD9AF88|nr:uncharacterized protein LOC111888836 [Lactuca sativa]